MNPIIEILSIDDSKAVHAYLDHCIEGTNFKLTHAMGTKEGLEKIRMSSSKFSLILLDWEMPEMTGPETLDLFKKEEIKIPVIMLSSKNEMADIASMLEKGAKDYILKPFTPDILIEKILTVIG